MTAVILCLIAALFPWILLLLRRFSGAAQLLPSLLFFYEEQGGRLSNWRRYLIYAFQSLFFLMQAVYFYSGLRFAERQFFCVVDDHLRSGLTTEAWQKWRRSYEKLCRDQFYSAAALAENQLKLIQQPIRLRGNPPLIAENMTEWLRRTGSELLLFLTREDNYLELSASELENLFLYSEPLPAVENYFFRKFSVEPDPLDYRRKYLRVHTQPGAVLLVERPHSRQSARADEQGIVTLQIAMPDRVGLEIVRLTLQQDQQVADNLALLPLLWYESVRLSGSKLPKSIVALQQMPEFPYYPFSQGGRGSLQVIVPNCGRGMLGFIDSENEIFSRLPVYQTCGGAGNNKQERILLRFRDGRPAVTAGGGQVHVWFEPDQVAEELLRHPAYALLLAQTLWRAAAPVNIQEQTPASGDSEYPAVYYGQQLLTEPAILAAAAVTVVNYHPEAATNSGKVIPKSKIYPANKDRATQVHFIWVFFSLVFLLSSFMLQFPLNVRNHIR